MSRLGKVAPLSACSVVFGARAMPSGKHPRGSRTRANGYVGKSGWDGRSAKKVAAVNAAFLEPFDFASEQW